MYQINDGNFRVARHGAQRRTACRECKAPARRRRPRAAGRDLPIRSLTPPTSCDRAGGANGVRLTLAGARPSGSGGDGSRVAGRPDRHRVHYPGSA